MMMMMMWMMNMIMRVMMLTMLTETKHDDGANYVYESGDVHDADHIYTYI